MPRNCWTRCNKTFPCSFPAREKTREIESRETSKRLEKQAILALLRKMIYKSELERLLPRAGESASIDARILELDSQLERSIYGDAAISLPIKKDFTAEKINELISKIDLLIEGE